ncbi:MAG: VirB4 family type IV secretion system protein [Chloroflexota bacterium]
MGSRSALDTTSLATTFPFSSSTLAMQRGVLFGVARHNHSPVIVDPFDASLENANTVVFAKSGAGKSYLTKLISSRLLPVGIDSLIIDPENEYRRVCDAAEGDGQYIRLASSSVQHLNPFDLPAVDDDGQDEGQDPLAEHVTELLRLLEVMLTEPERPFGAHERAVLDRALYQTYAGVGITSDPETHGGPAPLLRDLSAALSSLPGDVAASLSARLRRYVDGSLGGLFSAPTNVALDRRLTVFNTQSLEEELQPVAIHLITNFIWTQVRRSRKPRLLILDEAWKLMQFPEGASFIASLARRARKYYLGLITVTQDVSDFLNSEHGRTVLTNASLKVLMKQDSSTIEPVTRAFQLSNEERQFLLAAAKGEALFFAGGSHLALQVEASPAEHRLITTAPQELAAMQLEQRLVAVAGGAR